MDVRKLYRYERKDPIVTAQTGCVGSVGGAEKEESGMKGGRAAACLFLRPITCALD